MRDDPAVKQKMSKLDYLIKVIAYLAILVSVYHLVIAWTGVRQPLLHRAVHLGGFLAVYYGMQFTKNFKAGKKALSVLDACFFLVACAIVGYQILNIDWIATRIAFLSPLPLMGKIIAVSAIVLIFDATRRTLGWGLPIIAGTLLLYTYFGYLVPGWLYHKGLAVPRIIDMMYFTTESIFGMPIAATSTYVTVFVLFGSFFAVSGAGDFMMKFANAVIGTARGGPAKIAVLSSALFGSINGSPVANTVTTGSITIPMMKRMGYSGVFAGAVEASASTGGAILPPVMGSAAFLMVELTGIPYSELMVRGIIPGIMYYICILCMVDNEALRLGLKGLRKEDLPNLLETMKEGMQFFVPLALMICLIVAGYPLMRVGLITILVIVACSWLRKSTRMTLKKIAEALESGAKTSVSMVAACATAGIIIGSIGATGLGGKITSMALQLTGGNMLLTFIFAAVVCVIFGMGMTLPAAYLLTASLMAPALIQVGVPIFVAHFFIIYFATASAITPPVAVASYAAAGIAGVPPNKVGWKACVLGMGIFLIPFAFGFNQSLLGYGSTWLIILNILMTIIGLVAIQSSLQGYMWTRLAVWQRVLLFFAGFSTIHPNVILSLCGSGVVLAMGVLLIIARRHHTRKGGVANA